MRFRRSSRHPHFILHRGERSPLDVVSTPLWDERFPTFDDPYGVTHSVASCTASPSTQFTEQVRSLRGLEQVSDLCRCVCSPYLIADRTPPRQLVAYHAAAKALAAWDACEGVSDAVDDPRHGLLARVANSMRFAALSIEGLEGPAYEPLVWIISELTERVDRLHVSMSPVWLAHRNNPETWLWWAVQRYASDEHSTLFDISLATGVTPRMMARPRRPADSARLRTLLAKVGEPELATWVFEINSHALDREDVVVAQHQCLAVLSDEGSNPAILVGEFPKVAADAMATRPGIRAAQKLGPPLDRAAYRFVTEVYTSGGGDSAYAQAAVLG